MDSPFQQKVGTAVETHFVSSAEEFKQRMRDFIALFNSKVPEERRVSEHAASGPPRYGPLIEQSRWKIACAECGNWPAYSPEWRLACCFECGAVYEDLDVAGDAPAIEEAALQVEAVQARNWDPGDLTVADVEIASVIPDDDTAPIGGAAEAPIAKGDG